jgi:hypothetical protein
MPRNYDDGRLVSVKILGFSNLEYVFRTRVKQGTSTDLGHKNINIQQRSSANGVVVGAQSPKPPRATKRTETGIESSFVDSGSISSARNKGYTIRKGKIRTPRNTQFTKIRYVNINGISYAWNAPTGGNVSLPAGVTEGIPTGNVVFGADFPKPPKVQKPFGDEESDSAGTFSTFIDPDQIDSAIQNGWIPSEDGVYTIEDLKQFL